MKLSYNWLAELVPKLSASPEEIAQLLTMHSFETQVTGRIDIDPAVIAARITQLAPHPNADRLQLATVDIGGGRSVTVVCGAPNIAVGGIVPYAAPGAQLYDDAGARFTLAEATIRGHVSPGMLASLRELGLHDQHAGIYILPADTPAGTPLRDRIPADTILDADITPNRAHDCMSHLGIARELAALLDLSVAEPPAGNLPAAAAAGWEVVIADPHDTPRYIGILISGVAVRPSPLWLQARLFAVGQRPINNVVDITNYVMFEQGNPLHAFAAGKLPGKTITVRPAKSAEILTTLDGKQQSLQPGQLVIDSAGTPVALAGVMGGLATEVDAATRDLFLEAANFRAYAIQQASASLRLITESSKRFARGLPPATAAASAARAVRLLAELAGGKPLGMIDRHPAPAARSAIRLRPERVAQMAGWEVSAADSAAILRRLRCTVEANGRTWQVTPPPERLDLTGEHDLIEEVIRVQGLQQIPDKEAAVAAPVPPPRAVQLREYLRDRLVQAGFTEVYNQPFEHLQIARTLGIDAAGAVAVANPIGPEQAHLRVSLLPRLCEDLLTNKGEVRLAKSSRSRNLFEAGTVWRTGEGGQVSGVVEEEQVAGVIVDGGDARVLLQDILAELGVDTPAGEQLMSAGPLPPAALYRLKLPPHIQFFTLNLHQVLLRLPEDFNYTPAAGSQASTSYQPLSKYPPAYRDISLLVAPGTAAESVQEIIERAGGELVADADLFDVYDGDEKTSYAFHIKYQAYDHTLTDNEVEAAHQRISAALAAEIGAEIR